MGGSGDLSNALGYAVGTLAAVESLRSPGGLSRFLNNRQMMLADPAVRSGLGPFGAGTMFVGGDERQPVEALPPGFTGPPQATGPAVWSPDLPALDPQTALQQEIAQLGLSAFEGLNDDERAMVARQLAGIPARPEDVRARLLKSMDPGGGGGAGGGTGRFDVMGRTDPKGNISFTTSRRPIRTGVAPPGSKIVTEGRNRVVVYPDGTRVKFDQLPAPRKPVKPPFDPVAAARPYGAVVPGMSTPTGVIPPRVDPLRLPAGVTIGQGGVSYRRPPIPAPTALRKGEFETFEQAQMVADAQQTGDFLVQPVVQPDGSTRYRLVDLGTLSPGDQRAAMTNLLRLDKGLREGTTPWGPLEQRDFDLLTRQLGLPVTAAQIGDEYDPEVLQRVLEEAPLADAAFGELATGGP